MRKTAIVTGGARRIGAAICEMLHDNGFNLLIHYNTSEREAVALLDQFSAKRPGSVAIWSGDLSDSDTPSLLVEAAQDTFGRLDLLVNNASVFGPTQIDEVDGRSWATMIDTNLRAPVLLALAAAPQLKKNKGNIINITDIHASIPMRNHLFYNISKAGLAAATAALALDLAPEIRVNAIAPGSNIWPESGHYSLPSVQSHIIDHIPLHRNGTPSDIAKALRFLVLECDYMTGQTLFVDGGRSLCISD